MIDSKLLDRERKQFFIQTLGSVYLPIVGIVFWLSLGVAGYFLSPRTVCLAVFSIIVILLPIALLSRRWVLGKLLSKSPLASLIFPSLIPVLTSFGITIPLYFTNMALVPLAFALGLSFHWPAFAWLYNQRGFIIHSLVRTVLAVSIWYFYPEQLFTWLPLSLSFLYLATVIWLLFELHKATEDSDHRLIKGAS